MRAKKGIRSFRKGIPLIKFKVSFLLNSFTMRRILPTLTLMQCVNEVSC